MKKYLLVAAVAAVVVVGGCRFFNAPVPLAHGFPDIPWYLQPFLYCFISASQF